MAACYIALQNTIPMDLVGRERAPLAVACVWFFTGIAYLTSYPLSGIPPPIMAPNLIRT